MLVVEFYLKNSVAWFKLQERHRYIILSCDKIHPTAMFDASVIEESIIMFSFIPIYTLKLLFVIFHFENTVLGINQGFKICYLFVYFPFQNSVSSY